MTQSNGYFYLPFQHETVQDLLEWVKSVLPNAKIELPYKEHLKDKLKDIILFRFVIQAGFDRKSVTVMLIDKNPFLLDDTFTCWTRFRMDARADSISDVFNKLTLEMNGWSSPTSKDFTQPATGKKHYLFIGGEQSTRTLTQEDAINEIFTADPDNSESRYDLLRLTKEELAKYYTFRVCVDAFVIDGEITVPIPTK